MLLSYRKPGHLKGQSRYGIAELVEMRRQIFRLARAVPPGSDRNHHRQIELSLRSLFRDKKWLDAHTVKQ
jgi:hypothetical protein